MRKFLNFRTFLFIGVGVLLIVLITAQQSVLDRNIERNAAIKKDIQQMQQHIQDLEDEKEMLGTDEYIEKKAREKLGYVKSDETVFIKNE